MVVLVLLRQIGPAMVLALILSAILATHNGGQFLRAAERANAIARESAGGP